MSAAPADVQVSKDLRDIAELSYRLQAQAVVRANGAIPGGAAMVNMAPSARPSEVQRRLDYEEGRALDDTRPWPDQEHEDADEYGTALWQLWYYSDDLRQMFDKPILTSQATIASEAEFLRDRVQWLYENEPGWIEFTKTIDTVKRRLEDLLQEGERDKPTRVHCDRPGCTHPRLLQLVEKGGLTDRFKCPKCDAMYDLDAFGRAYKRQLIGEGAEKYLPLRDAVAALSIRGTPEKSVKRWLEAEGVEDVIPAYCEVGSRRRMVWWPALFSKDQEKRQQDLMRRRRVKAS